MIRLPERQNLNNHVIKEHWSSIEGNVLSKSREIFEAVASGKKRHKL